MANELSMLRQSVLASERDAVLALNDTSSRYGLTLTPQDVELLQTQRESTLRDTGRVELGGGVLPKLVFAFCDSPYLQQDEYAQTLLLLQEAFYVFKGEAMETLSDDELIAAMKRTFDGRAEGDVDYLMGTSLTRLCRGIRLGCRLTEDEPPYGEDEEDEWEE